MKAAPAQSMPPFRQNLQNWLRQAAGAAAVEITGLMPLSGGAIQENWLIDCRFDGGQKPGRQRLVMRCDAPAKIASSLSRAREFKVLRAVHCAGVMVPEPLWLCEDEGIIGRAFYIMSHVEGIALASRIVKDESLGGDRQAMAARLAGELARIHSLRPPIAGLEFLVPPVGHPAHEAVAVMRQHLDDMDEQRPALEWGLRWAELHVPRQFELTLVHQDFRTGNYLVSARGLAAILDWEFAGWGDPMSDLGWFCAKCWRFARPDLEAGGITSRRSFYEHYEAASGRSIDHAAVAFWEVMAHVRWAVIALQQCHRHLSGTEPSLELALIGRLLPDLELSIVELSAPTQWKPR